MNHKVLERMNLQEITVHNSHSTFLQLPAEIRNLVYKLMIESHLKSTDRVHRYDGNPSVHFIPLTFTTCRQIRSEGLGVLHGDFVKVARQVKRYGVLTEFNFSKACNLSLKPVTYPAVARLQGGVSSDECLRRASQTLKKPTCVVYRTSDTAGSSMGWNYRVYECCY